MKPIATLVSKGLIYSLTSSRYVSLFLKLLDNEVLSKPHNLIIALHLIIVISTKNFSCRPSYTNYFAATLCRAE